MNNIKRLYKTLVLMGLIFLFSMIVVWGQSIKKNDREEYIGRLSRIYLFRGEKIDMFSSDSYIYGNYIMEELTRVKIYSSTVPEKRDSTSIRYTLQGKSNNSKGHREIVVEKYLLTNLKTGRTFVFDTSSSHPALITTHPVDRKSGLTYVDANPEGYTYRKDSIVNGRKVKLLTKKDEVKLRPGADKVKVRRILYINPGLKGFPVNPLNEYWADKYNGFCYREDVVMMGNNEATNSVVYKFTPGLEREDLIRFKKLIKTAEN